MPQLTDPARSLRDRHVDFARTPVWAAMSPGRSFPGGAGSKRYAVPALCGADGSLRDMLEDVIGINGLAGPNPMRLLALLEDIEADPSSALSGAILAARNLGDHDVPEIKAYLRVAREGDEVAARAIEQLTRLVSPAGGPAGAADMAQEIHRRNQVAPVTLYGLRFLPGGCEVETYHDAGAAGHSAREAARLVHGLLGDLEIATRMARLGAVLEMAGFTITHLSSDLLPRTGEVTFSADPPREGVGNLDLFQAVLDGLCAVPGALDTAPDRPNDLIVAPGLEVMLVSVKVSRDDSGTVVHQVLVESADPEISRRV